MSRESFDCLKPERDICVIPINIRPSGVPPRAPALTAAVYIGVNGGLMVTALVSGLSGLGSNPGSHSASLPPGV